MWALLTLICGLAAAEEDSVFVLAYFRTPAEALHLASSPDGLTWTALNKNEPVLRAEVGNRSIRDPFIRKGPDGLYHLVSTNSWKATNLIHVSSPDLVHWSEQTLLPVMEGMPGTKNVWAPEYVYDEARGDYLLFWSSVTEPEGDHQRIWCCRTKDFKTVSEPKMLFDPGYTVIDATIVPDGKRWVMAFKDERGENKAGTDNKGMRMAVADALEGPYTVVSDLVTPHLTEGPTLFQAGGRWLMLFDCFLEGKWGAVESTDLDLWHPLEPGPLLPADARHGSVFTISAGELATLTAAFSGTQP